MLPVLEALVAVLLCDDGQVGRMQVGGDRHLLPGDIDCPGC